MIGEESPVRENTGLPDDVLGLAPMIGNVRVDIIHPRRGNERTGTTDHNALQLARLDFLRWKGKRQLCTRTPNN